jgi:hypothetical protein
MFIIYNCGYYSAINLNGLTTKKKYSFKKRFVTEVDDKDGESFLSMTYKDIQWCPTNSKTIPPFMKLEDWCSGKEGRFDFKPLKIYDPEEYKKLFKL